MKPATASTNTSNITETLTYSVGIGYRFLYGLLGLVFAIGGIVVAVSFMQAPVKSPQANVLLSAVALTFAFIGAYLVLWVFRSRVTLNSNDIEVTGAWISRRLQRDEILGWRTVQQRNMPPSIVLIPRGLGRKLTLHTSIKLDARFHAWLSQLPNLDDLDRERSMQELLSDPEIAPTQEQRGEAYVQARRNARWALGVSIAVFVWAWLYPEPYALVTAILGLMPWAMLLWTLRSGGMYRLDNAKNDVRPNLAAPFIFPGFLLALRSVQDFHFTNWSRVCAIAMMVGIVMCICATTCDRKFLSKPANVVALLFALCVYGFGATLQVNAQLDASPETRYRAEVLGKNISSGRHAEYRLTLSRWRVQDDSTTVSVPRAMYRKLAVHDPVCIASHNGALSIPWYELWPCADGQNDWRNY